VGGERGIYVFAHRSVADPIAPVDQSLLAQSVEGLESGWNIRQVQSLIDWAVHRVIKLVISNVGPYPSRGIPKEESLAFPVVARAASLLSGKCTGESASSAVFALFDLGDICVL
jgi:hypothetical protein